MILGVPTPMEIATSGLAPLNDHRRDLEGEVDREVLPALRATGAGEATGENSAFQVTAELALAVSWHLETRRVIEVPKRLG